MSVLFGTAVGLLEQSGDQHPETIRSSLSIPQDPSHGDISSNLAFSISHTDPTKKAAEIVTDVDDSDAPLSVSNSGPYINFRLDEHRYFTAVFDDFDFSQRSTTPGSIEIETAPPNIGDWYSPLLYRGLCVWEGLAGICTHLGYDVTQLLFWNDCGKPAGTMLADRIAADTTPWTGDHPPYEDRTWEGLAVTIESATEGELLNFWHTVRSEYQQDLLGFLDSHGFQWDDFIRESDTWEQLDDLRDRLIQSDLVEIDNDNSVLIRFPDSELPPRIAFKGNGASVYFVRDLAELQRRVNQSYDHLFYVVSSNQQTHLDQLFTTGKALGMPNLSRCEHIAYGLVGGGSNILETLLSDIRDHIGKSGLWEADDRSIIARSVMRLYVLNRTRTKEMQSLSTDIQESLSAEWTLVRTRSRVRSLVEKISATDSIQQECDDVILTQAEQKLLKRVDQRWDVVEDCFEKRDTYPLVRYLQLLSKDFNSFYETCPVIMNGHPHPTRRALCLMTDEVFETAFDMLNLPLVNHSVTAEHSE